MYFIIKYNVLLNLNRILETLPCRQDYVVLFENKQMTRRKVCANNTLLYYIILLVLYLPRYIGTRHCRF